MACFAFNEAFAQSSKQVFEGSMDISNFQMPCIGETVSGEIFYKVMLIGDGKNLEKYWGTMVGDETGNVYTAYQVSNYNYPTSKNFTQTMNFKFRMDGKLVFTWHILVHFTELGGELIVDHAVSGVNCK